MTTAKALRTGSQEHVRALMMRRSEPRRPNRRSTRNARTMRRMLTPEAWREFRRFGMEVRKGREGKKERGRGREGKRRRGRGEG
eukprot:2736611-Rhodomonas_salina.1